MAQLLMETAATTSVSAATGTKSEVGRRAARRNSRCKPAAHSTALRQTERDFWIIEALAKMRFLNTSQLAELFFHRSRWAANKRLRRLLDAGLIRAWVRNLSDENIYSITSQGLGWLDQEESGLASELRSPKRLDENLEHHLAINDVRISLAVGLNQAPGEIIWWRSDWDLRAQGRGRIIPDGLFAICWDGHDEHAYALEVDNHTKSSKNFLRKLLAYTALQNRGEAIYGIAAPTILVAGADPKWLARYRLRLGNIGINLNVWFAALAEIRLSGALSSIWQAAESENKYSLRELSCLPYRKELRASLT